MARLNFGFKTNVENKDNTIPNQVDSFIFLTKDGNYLTISCAGEENWGLSDKEMNGDWKGLEYYISDKDYDEIKDWNEEDNTEDFVKLLTGANLVAFYMDDDALAENGYSAAFIPVCKDVSIDIDVPYKGDSITFEFSAKELITEEELLANIKSQREDIER